MCLSQTMYKKPFGIGMFDVTSGLVKMKKNVSQTTQNVNDFSQTGIWYRQKKSGRRV